MTTTFETQVSQPIHISFLSKTLATGNAGSYTLTLVKNGVTYNDLEAPAVFSEIGSGMYSVMFTLTEAGNFFCFSDDQLIAVVQCYSQSTRSQVSSILDATVGSWRWDKITGKLTVYGVSGQVVATYNVEDTVDKTSRQKIS